MNGHFRTSLCVDGSASQPNKRPIYHVAVTEEATMIHRWREERGILAICETTIRAPTPVLVTADVPIGLPYGFPEVFGEARFVDWLANRQGNWRELVADSVANQTIDRPFVVCKKGEKKYDGNFPLRRCEQMTQGESLYWCVGGKQVGKAALQFWHDTLLPLRRAFGDRLAVWPFEPIDGKDVVVAECYPAMLYQAVWNRRVTKSNPCDVVDAIAVAREKQLNLCDDKTWLHAASSEDEFDMFTTAMAIASWKCDPDSFLTAPQDDRIRNVEGWMIGLRDRETEPN
jgi:hypothetical protein